MTLLGEWAAAAATSAPDAVADGPAPAAVEARQLSRRFRSALALDRVSLRVGAGEIHALLGPNGAGKTTLLRIFTGLLAPDEGEVLLHGAPSASVPRRAWRQLFGLVPSGDRSFYLRISGLENLVFFARLHGLRRARARERAWECLDAVGLGDVGGMPVNTYSHGMQKRLSVARALLMDPPVLFVDEATHDLDPEAARRVRTLATAAAARGTAVVWTTQRLDEIRAFADHATLLCRGEVRFQGTVAQLIARAESRSYVVQVEHGRDVMGRARAALSGKAAVRLEGGADADHYVVTLHDHAVLGDAVAALSAAGLSVLRCREERSEIEEAFIRVTEDPR